MHMEKKPLSLGKSKKKQAELSRATLKFSFNSSNNAQYQNISVWAPKASLVQTIIWVYKMLGLKKCWWHKFVGLKFFALKLFIQSGKMLVPKISGPKIFGSVKFFSLIDCGCKTIWSTNLLVQNCFWSTIILGPTNFLQKILV